jgi:hypothetical protein
MNRPAIRAISLATGGGLVFSWALMRLGSDMESPELLRYILIATLPLTLLLMLALIQFRVRSIRRTLFAGFVLSAIMCIPMESFAFVISEWSLRGSEVFERNHLPLLLLLLVVWEAVIGILASLGSLGLIHLRPARKILQDSESLRHD